MKYRRYGDVLITLTSQYKLRYADHGSGARWDGTFWHPKSDGNFRPLGSVCVGGHANINFNRASMLLANAPDHVALAAPLDYSWVWDDHGSGAKTNCSVWRPVPPEGYVALGDVAASGYLKPSLSDIWCVRADLVTSGVFTSGPAWRDAGSKGRHDIAAWPVEVGDSSRDLQMGILAPDTFIGVASYDFPPDAGLARVIQIPIVVDERDMPERPMLKSRREPRDPISPVKDRSVVLPFTALLDRTDRPSLNKIEDPFCTIERSVNWSLIAFDDNTTTAPQTITKSVTVGFTVTEAQSFAHSTGVKAGLDIGDKIKFKIELNYQFTHIASSSTSSLLSTTVIRNLTTPPGVAAALWTTTYTFRVTRADGTVVGRDLRFDVDNVAHDQYPPAAHNIQKATISSRADPG
ncbi:Vps62-related protein [Sphingomonas sp. CBMAI 2297]|uniref:Vps62-related protein n=1 Tax=Sphingomonas sp. CBMAI 2297 TaxID=2991720 RepID=UPI002456A3E6|nr:Vps62-related protein [Sphingomonas sp. CBMAI 2297]MDH4743142.1 Vps62-related protein [Sphingomonas sp. CBMAI 2297]